MRIAAEQFGGPVEAAIPQPVGGKAAPAMLFDDTGHGELVTLGRGGGKGERHFAKAQFEQAITARGLTVIIALGRCPAEDFNLAVVQSEAAIDTQNLGFDRPVVGQEDSRRAAFDNRGRDVAAVDVGQALRGEDDAGVLLAQRLQPFAELAGETLVVERPKGRHGERGCPPVEDLHLASTAASASIFFHFFSINQ